MPLLYYPSANNQVSVHFVNDRLLVLGQRSGVEAFLKTGPASGAGPLTPALEKAAGKTQIVIGFNPPEAMVREVLDAMPADALALKQVLDVKRAMLTSDLDATGMGTLTANYADATKAEAASGTISAVVGFVQLGLWGVKKAVPPEYKGFLDPIIDGYKVEQNGAVVSVFMPGAIPAVLVGMLLPSVQKVREASSRAMASNNLKQLTLGVITYADAMEGVMPTPTIYSRDGKPLYSWRVAILPYVSDDPRHRQVKWDEPWDSAHNKPLLAKMPKVFEMPGVAAPEGQTYLQVFTGPGTAFDGQRKRFPASFTDGASNTILIVEAAQPVHWAAPGNDIVYSPQVSPLKQIGARSPAGTHAALADGSVRMLSRNLTEKTLRALITPAGNEIIGPDGQ